MTLPNACPKPPKREKAPKTRIAGLLPKQKPVAMVARKPIRQVSEKRAAKLKADALAFVRKAKAIKARNPKRQKRERLRAHGTPEFDAWIKAQHCVVCGFTPCDPAHTLSGGGSRKGDAESIIPICRLHHAEQHQFGKHTFAARHNLDIPALREETQRAWLASSEYAAWEARQK